MPLQTIIVVSLVAAAFATFGLTLFAVGWYERSGRRGLEPAE